MTASGAELARGRALHPGSASGPALVLEPLSFWGGLAWEDGRIIDVHHPACGRVADGHRARDAARPRLELGGRRDGRGRPPRHRAGRRRRALDRRDPLVGAIAAAELYGVRCPVVQLDADGFAAVAAHDGARLAVEAGDEDGVVSLAAP